MTKKPRGTLSADLAAALSRLAEKGKTVFAVQDFAEAAGRPKSRVWRVLNFLLEGGWIVRLAKGRYFIVPLEAGPESIWTEDALVVAGNLTDRAAAAYWTACHYWNWTEQVPRTVFVQTPQRVRPRKRTILGVQYRFVCVNQTKFFGTVKRQAGRGSFTVTNREKALVDAFDHPELCGGIRQVADMLPAAAETVRWGRVDEYLGRMASGAVYKRLGLLVESHGKKVTVPEHGRRLEAWHAHLTGGYAPLEPGGPETGPVNNRWLVRLNVRGIVPEGASG